MFTDYIFNTPANTLLSEMPEGTQQVINSLGSEFPSFPMIGTIEVEGRKLIHVRMEKLIPKIYLETLLQEHNLDWQILAIRSAFKEPDYLIEFMAPKETFLPFMENQIDPIYLSTYIGTDPIQL